LPGSKIQINGTVKANKAIVSWRVDDELLASSNKFVVERTSDNSSYTAIAEVNAETGRTNYSIDDILSAPGKAYNYRIRIVKKDNTGAYSTSILLKTKLQDNEISFYPNPAQNELNYYTGTTVKNAQVAIYDMSGAVVKQSTFSGNNMRLNISILKSGTYYLKVQQQDGSDAKMHKFVKL